MERYFFVLLFCVFNSCHQDPQILKDYKSENIILFVIDGPRFSETWGDPTKVNVPFEDSFFRNEGVVFSSFRNEGKTLTNPGHIALCTGNYEDVANNGSELPKSPSFMQYVIQKYPSFVNRCWVIASKDKLEVLADCTASGYSGKYKPKTDCGNSGNGSGYRSDSITMARVFQTLQTEKPRVLVVNLKDPDVFGHQNKWSNYIEAIRKSDTYVKELVEYLELDSFYKNKTTLFVTNDHGRHLDGVADGFVSHGDGCEGCRHIAGFVWGPDIKRGVVINNTYSQIDFTATIAALLKISMPSQKGRIINELFE